MRRLLISMIALAVGCGPRHSVPPPKADAGTEQDAGCKTGWTESTVALCYDGCDNDGNIFFDCSELKCCGIRSDCPQDTYCGGRADGSSFTAPITIDDQLVEGIDPDTLPAGMNPCHEPTLVTVESVADGDTIYVSGYGINIESVRVIGVDTPEIEHAPNPAECYADEAAAFTDQLWGHRVWLTFDSVCRDRYDRLLAYVYFGTGKNDMLERQLLRRGFARAFAFGDTLTFSSLFSIDESIARDGDIGLWSACP